MVQIRNLLFQPLTFNLTDGRTLHFGVRESKVLTEDMLSEEVRKAGARGLLELVESKSPPAQISEQPASEASESNTATKRRR